MLAHLFWKRASQELCQDWLVAIYPDGQKARCSWLSRNETLSSFTRSENERATKEFFSSNSNINSLVASFLILKMSEPRAIPNSSTTINEPTYELTSLVQLQFFTIICNNTIIKINRQVLKYIIFICINLSI